MSSPLFSVLISTYHNDNPLHLDLALGSIFKQSLLPNQVVLVIDGPIPETLKRIINTYYTSFPAIVDIHPLERNIGLGPALNFGLLQCRNEIVARMDSDDISLKDRFKKQIDYLQVHLDVDVLGADVEEFSEEPGDLKRINKAPKASELYSYSRWRNPINHPTVVFKKSVVLASNSYEDVPYFEDYYLWINILHKGYKIDNLQEVLVHFRNDSDTIGRRHGLNYIRHEMNFLNLAYANSYLEFKYYIAGIFIRLPLRIIPKRLLSLFYHYVLRQ
ncbi:glycosyltransferase [Dyadobacter diqingensis]|uniref:glycosyltransferase n=1 Tax=Dyadobacter diqingensis TaxID=2938121 RepID=UPI0020C19E8C|nr:glycosyltransferase [Dyadobacter diqingensis]